METIKSNLGATVTIDNGAKITSIGGRPCELYMIGVNEVYGHPTMRRQPRAMRPSVVELQRYIGISSVDTQPVYGPILTVSAQSEPEAVQVWDKITGAMVKIADEALIFNSIDLGKDYSTVKVLLKNDFNARMFADIWEFNLVNVTYVGADPFIGRKGTPNPNPTPIAVKKVDVTEQYQQIDGEAVKIGDACVIIARDLVSLVDLEAAEYFTLSENGGDPVRYTIWNSDGLKYLQTYDWELYLRKLK